MNYTYDEALAASVEYFGGNKLAADVFVKKYALTNDKDEYVEKTPDDMHQRLAKEFARIEKNKFKEPLSEEFIYELFKDFKYVVCQGSPSYAIGNPYKYVSASNCYLLSVPDDMYSSILDVDKELVNISKRRGGVGICIDNLRPAGTKVNNSAKSSTGPISFMRRYSNSIREVGQMNRRGALLISMSIHHPDSVHLLPDGETPKQIVVNPGMEKDGVRPIHTTTEWYNPEDLDFCSVKYDRTQITGANISLTLTNEFMQAVENGITYEQRWPIDSDKPVISRQVDARKVWQKIMRASWEVAEPGLLYWSTVQKYSPCDIYTTYSSRGTNPSLRGDTEVLTNRGYVQIKDLCYEYNYIDDDLLISNINEQFVPFKCFLTGKNKQLWKIELNNGEVVYCTPEHKWPVINNMLGSPFITIETSQLIAGQHSFWPVGDWCQKSIVRINSVGPTNIYEDVYDMQLYDDTHTFAIKQGVYTSNCSEINLSPLDSCRLMFLNLFSFVSNPFTKEAKFEYEKFYKYAQYIQRLMDDLVDLEAELIKRIIGKIKKDKNYDRDEVELWEKILKFNNEGRRTGTGISALGDTLAALGIKYGSQESINTTTRIYETLKLGCYRASVDMAIELGAFKEWDAEKEKGHPFIEGLHPSGNSMHLVGSQEIYYEMMKHGRRNIALTTTAPVGSLSLLLCVDDRLRLFSTSSGIEPAIWLEYMRRRKINDEEDTKPDFVDQSGDKWQNYKVYHNPVNLWKYVTGEDDVSKSPWHGACANDINWVDGVSLQAAAQRHVCHSISRTQNLPANATVEQISEIFMEGWKKGLKGMTVYRDGCRSGVLIKEDSDKGSLTTHHAPKRPKILPGEIFTTKVKGEEFFVAIGLMGDSPYEVFIGKNCCQKHQKVNIHRLARGQYRLENPLTGEQICDNITETCDETEEAIARLVSTSLRHGADIHFLVQQLEKSKGNVASLSKALARVLKKYVKDGTKVTGEACNECKSEALQRQEGCVICTQCGWSKCG